ncbi:Uncharacterized membrane protein YGL010W [Ferrimonas sediminum]|uniref:Uncharacterized membrane protein YGL010W n=1 Tax=Ferrimonas sediminum TaxID=718193 RepID=A0A1G9AFU1_9GAMM|nr:Mpo1-like protein [Ferrimonas sediminum]SDK26226.1 Uncharacterized membrane protein YGL010W [Ferrimonas sediminum]
MKDIEQWFAEYGESHRNPTNKTIHWICVPLITFSVLGALWALSPLLTWALIAVALVFYLNLSRNIALAMALVTGFMLLIISNLTNLFMICAVIFVLAWIGQFYGHHVEGKKPSFFKDVQFLLIGPIWLLGFVFRKRGWHY